ncbi:membrane protein [Mycolicibacterium insubricum]|jgi:hypothetical protein|uniref:Uncharacterized protein n=1 Tax=Mycolicibacterium insubricum TaxID=444597 RepID=A0A1X0D0T1_9MYCO|nr:hypothetical protein [Mycolicibacterium insubricum]MCB9442459.1 hypothetical protein [Mycolicibacterium sp.]MCV7080686.1 hypothetical protein [Mycolicibacterium insubricum]ORA65380.1 hypothetical protein BST26_18640 [Mycolicibacterium insubricum]BBZ65361.1 membrane protein [Mycolicibacterium insubricum]
MRNIARLVAFDVLAPLVTVAALAAIGIVLMWPKWWVAVFAALCVLIAQAAALNFFLLRRDGVTVGTDDDGPGLRLAVTALMAVVVIAAATVGYTQWTRPDRTFDADRSQAVQVATQVAEATATFSPSDPLAGIEKAAAMMTADTAKSFRTSYAGTTAELAKNKVSQQGQVESAGIQALVPNAATVLVVLRLTQSTPGKAATQGAAGLLMSMTKDDGRWLVADIAPLQRGAA